MNTARIQRGRWRRRCSGLSQEDGQVGMIAKRPVCVTFWRVGLRRPQRRQRLLRARCCSESSCISSHCSGRSEERVVRRLRCPRCHWSLRCPGTNGAQGANGVIGGRACQSCALGTSGCHSRAQRQNAAGTSRQSSQRRSHRRAGPGGGPGAADLLLHGCC